jgi:hypothetical protein
MKYILIKAGGSGNIYKSNLSVDYSYLSYRQMKIDSSYYNLLCENICELSRKYKVGFTVGGVAGFLFMNFAKELNNTDNEIKTVGNDIVNITANIVLNYFISKKINICPKLIDVYSDIESYFKDYDLLIFQPSFTIESTDSIIALASLKLEESILVYFKTNLQERLYDQEKPDIDYLKSISNIKQHMGNSPLLDMQTLSIIEEYNKSLILCDKSLSSKLNSIVNQKAFDKITICI